MCTLAGHTSHVVSVSFDPDGKRVVSGAEDNRVKIFTDVAMLAEVCRERASSLLTEREIFIDNLLVRVHLIIDMSRPALTHGSLNPLSQVALHLPSQLY